jgi:hypothetical protein
MRLLFLVTIALGLAAANPIVVHAQQVEFAGIQYDTSLAVIRPDFPIPDDLGQLIYLQRSSNANTVIYALRDGDVVAYWRRFNNNGAAKPLSAVERNLAFGVTTQRAADGDLELRVAAAPNFPMTLTTDQGDAFVYFETPNGVRVRISYLHVWFDEGALGPRVRRIVVVGTDEGTGAPLRALYRIR